eukprot:g26856.t1
MFIAVLLPTAWSLLPPSFPSSFTAEIEATISNKNYSVEVKEYYDYEHQRTRIEHHSGCERSEAKCSAWTLGFNDIQKLVSVRRMGDDDPTCTVQDMNNMRGSFGSGPLISSTEMFERHREDYVYQGKAMARGIECDWWQAVVSKGGSRPGINSGSRPGINSTYTLDYYFASPTWNFHESHIENPRPVRAVLSGCHLHLDTVNSDHVVCDGEFHHNYEYTSFLPYVDQNDYLWRVPANAFCPPIFPQRPLPILPDDFSAIIEADFTAKQYSMTVHEFYDYSNQRDRVDHYGSHGVRSHTNDFAAMMSYRFSKNSHGVVSCTSSNLTYAMEMDKNHHMKSARDFYELRAGLRNWTYQGSHYSVRGQRNCSLWTAIYGGSGEDLAGPFNVPLTYHVEWYFSDTKWKEFGREDLAGASVPMQTIVEGTMNGTAFRNIYEWVHFSAGSDELSDEVFALPAECFASPRVEFPVWPDELSLRGEMNSRTWQSTTLVTEAYDHANNRMRVDSDGAEGNTTEILFGTEGQHVRYNKSGCFVTPLESEFDMWDIGHSKLARQMNFTFAGRTYVRGVRCDKFVAFLDEFEMAGRGAIRNVSQTWFFAVEGWKDAMGARRPVRTLMKGVWVGLADATDASSAITMPFATEFDIFEYTQGVPLASLFRPHSTWRCPQPYATSPEQCEVENCKEACQSCVAANSDDERDAKLFKGLFGLVLFLLLATLCALACTRIKRKSGQVEPVLNSQESYELRPCPYSAMIISNQEPDRAEICAGEATTLARTADT